ncbi:scavenger receptor cysteine-rich type 1 protein M130 [Xyrauchen texanus]|uniref:scavenger receptor cysteine-rich type 1 protein M130 n=1 Tax=Xyrauchen texanus TaxID=154827 RepID=UPI0022420632|nr:scavenger receptor cysteine-rich type 1 protein M130 [Xyrauchen texanus]
MLRPLLDWTLAVVLSDFLLTGAQDVKLVNGFDICMGTVEVYYNDTWGTVCDDSWDIYDAAVVCRQLGCGRAFSAHNQALFGKGSDIIWLSGVNCEGNESSLRECVPLQPVSNDCSHSKDAGVVCSASLVVVIGAVLTAVLLLLSVLIIICLVKRTKKRKIKETQIFFSRDAVSMHEDVSLEDRYEENAEDDYEKVDIDDGESEENAEDDYEKVDIDDGESESDYVNMDGDPEQDNVNVESDNSEQDYVNVDTDDSEQDYVNVDFTEDQSTVDNNYEDL